MPMESAWEKYGERTIRDLWTAYKEEGKSSASYFARSAKSSWAPACDHTKIVAIPWKVATLHCVVEHPP